jgi:hypothetical protein
MMGCSQNPPAHDRADEKRTREEDEPEERVRPVFLDGKVTLSLPRASAERLHRDTVLFRFKAMITNSTGAELKIKAQLGTPFEGFDLVVLSDTGKRLVQQMYGLHLSNLSHGKWYVLKKGENLGDLLYPVQGLPKGLNKFIVLLVGELPGGRYKGVLCSDVVEVTVQE